MTQKIVPKISEIDAVIISFSFEEYIQNIFCDSQMDCLDLSFR